MATDEPSGEIDRSGGDATNLTEEDEESVFTATAETQYTFGTTFEKSFDKWVASPAAILWDDYRGRAGLIIVAVYLLMGTLGPILVPAPEANMAPRLLAPFENPQYPLGTTQSGRGLLSLTVHATPAMLKMIIAGALVGNLFGVTLGLISGYYGGVVDKVIMTITDTIGSIPGIPLLLILAAILTPQNPFVVGVMLNIQGWTGGARGIRSQVLPIRDKEYVEAAEAMGQPKSNLLVKEFLPELLPMIFIGFLGGATTIVAASVGLYFIGILPFSHLNWGVMLNSAQSAGAFFSPAAAHWLIVPLVAITGLTFGLTLLAQAFDQVFNPRVRARHEGRKRSREGEMDPDESASDATGAAISTTQ